MASSCGLARPGAGAVFRNRPETERSFYGTMILTPDYFELLAGATRCEDSEALGGGMRASSALKACVSVLPLVDTIAFALA